MVPILCGLFFLRRQVTYLTETKRTTDKDYIRRREGGRMWEREGKAGVHFQQCLAKNAQCLPSLMRRKVD